MGINVYFCKKNEKIYLKCLFFIFIFIMLLQTTKKITNIGGTDE